MLSKLIYNIGESGVLLPYDDAYAEIMVMERTDMTVAKTVRTAARFADNLTAVWIVREFGYNVANEMIYCRNISTSDSCPEWVPPALVEPVAESDDL